MGGMTEGCTRTVPNRTLLVVAIKDWVLGWPWTGLARH
jgi:hypothetical protein